MLHGICGIEIGPRTLLFKSETPFRIDDLEHHPIYRRDWTSNKPVSAGAFTNSPRDVIDSFIKELKYRKAKNDRIDELEKQTDKLKVMLSDTISSEKIIEEFTKKSARDDNEIKRLNSLVATYTMIADTPVLVAEEIPDVSDLKAQIQSLKLQLAAEKRISHKYAKTIQDRASALTAM
jgi:cell shape-determining protein MreC